MRKARSTACASVAGFHAGSTRMTRSALVRFRPTPPTLVVSSMHWKRSRWLLNLATLSARDMGSVWPSMRRQRRPFGLRQRIWIRSNIFRLCEKTSMRWPRFASAGMSWKRHRSFALCSRMASPLRESFLSIISMERPQRASSVAAAAAPVAPAMAARLSEAASEAIRSRPSTSAPPASSAAALTSTSEAAPASAAASAASAAAFCSASSLACAVVTSESSSAQQPGLGVGRSSSGWLHRRLSRPMARNTSMPSFDLEQASRITSLFSSTFL
mmetsp:Transcript_19036/g.48843  ORF Transcript_19036/g.48843 Transcript_19036/m.48843 type:complete len:272 (-) Transcript_19036:2164-2979(-)